MMYTWLAILTSYLIFLHLRIKNMQEKTIAELQNIAMINRELTEITRKEAHKNK